MLDRGGGFVVIARSRGSWLALALGALLYAGFAHADLVQRWPPPTVDTTVPSTGPLPPSKIGLDQQVPSRWELVTLVALGSICTAGALTFAVVAWRRRRDP